MKKMMLALIAMLTIAVSANAMSYEQARNEALFLTDKMAYELNLTDAQYEAAYEINLDYLMGVTSRYDVFGTYWERRNLDLSYILLSWQWNAFCAATYFYRPLYWDAGYWHFGIYAHYPRRDYFYFGRPHFFATYRGGHSWRMNGGRSFYEGHRDHYRASGGGHDNHHGMRDGWDRGDYRGGGSSSSTRVTGGERGSYRNGGSRSNGSDRDNNRGVGTDRDNRDNGSSYDRSSSSRSRASIGDRSAVGDRSASTFGGSRSSSVGERRATTESSRSTSTFGGSSRSTVGSSSRSTGSNYTPSTNRSSSATMSRSAGTSMSRSAGATMSRSSGSSMSRSSGASMSRSSGSAGGGSRSGGSFGGGSRSRR